jgi:hypothetical protein
VRPPDRVSPTTAQRYLCSLAQLDSFLGGKTLVEIDGALVGQAIPPRTSTSRGDE